MAAAPSNEHGSSPGSPASARVPYVVAFLIFVASCGATLYLTHAMSSGVMPHGMPMPGGWTMSMMWMPMGASALASAAIFTLMWLAMMIAMMLPSTMPMLLLYRRAAAFRGEAHLGRSMFALGIGYFGVWTIFGVTAYAIGVIVSRGAMRSPDFSRAVPLVAALALGFAGIYQLTPWKSACLKHCRDPLALVAGHLQGGRFGALRLGIHHGTFCAACCWGLMLIQIILGVMNLTVMVAVAAVIALEKLLVHGAWIAKATGFAAIAGGLVMAANAARAF